MKTNLDLALEYTFVNEGSYSDNPNDSGGATSGFGITIGELAKWRKTPVTKQDVRDMSAQEASDIYSAWYWHPMGCDQLVHANVAICMFDIGVVRGIGIPPKYAQQICNAHGASLVLDGHVGPKTIAAINAVDPSVFIRDFSRKAEDGFISIVSNKPSQRVFLKGWINRAQRLLTLINMKVS